MVRDLRDWITRAEDIGQVHRIDEEVDWDEEMGAITYVAHKEKGAPALLFENVKGYPEGYRVLFNIFSSSTSRLGLTLNADPELPEKDLIDLTRDKFSERVDPVAVDETAAPVYENTDAGDDVDLYEFPVPKMWPRDGGRYIGTACAAISRDPDTGKLNLGTYRHMLQTENETGLYTSPGKDLRMHMKEEWDRGEPLEVASVFGIQPELYLASSLPVERHESEYEYAGAIRGDSIETVEGKVTSLPIPANAEIVVEGKLHPGDTLPEGPFGEFTGYYGRPEDETPVLTVDAVHYRDDPILTSALMADYPGCDTNHIYSLGRSAQIWDEMEKNLGLTGIEGVYCHPAAAAVGMTIVSIDQQHAGHTSQVASIAAQCPSGAYFTKLIVVVDDDVEPTDINQVIWAIATRFNPEDDIDVLTNTWSTWLDPTQNPPEERPYGSKMLLDATKDHKHYDEFSKRNAITGDAYEAIADRWEEFGFAGEPPELPLFEEDQRVDEEHAQGESDDQSYSM